MELRLGDSEYRFAQLVWRHEPVASGRLVKLAAAELGWKKSTTYTVLRKCVAKGAVERMEPGFRCRALVSRAEVCRQETDELIRRNYGGSADRLVASLLGGKKLSAQEIERMKKLIEELE